MASNKCNILPVLKLLDEVANCFPDTPTTCGEVVHEIMTTADFAPKQLKRHRISELLNREDERQVAKYCVQDLHKNLHRLCHRL